MLNLKNKNFFQLSALVLLGVLFLGACSIKDDTKSKQIESGDNEVNKIKVATTIFPLYDLAQEIGGEKVETILLLPPGASPHTFEISPQKVKDLAGSQLLFMIGLKLDDWAINLVNKTNDVKVVDLSTAVELQTLTEEGDETGDFDPHYWLSPQQAKLIVNQIAKELSVLDEANSEYYLVRAQSYQQKIEEKITTWQSTLAKMENKNLVVFHDAWGYFASDFNLNIVANLEPFPGKSPSPKYLEEINKIIKQYQVKTLFVEPQLAINMAQTFAQDLDLEIRVLDPLGGLDNRDSYLSLIEYNVNEIAR
ncbi:MAG: metal ABC transporter substrate-binding protein [Patescibacteria group bacterium]|jgi:zinc transport system substrate-binding protein|nr:metal ABC transporter substrate-binding protein [bacterium]HQC49594.1 metal ABC transporter substrate-binding protein [bacterium]